MTNYSYPITNQVVAVGAASAATTNAVGAHIHRVRLCSTGTTGVHVAFGVSPTATTSNMFLAPASEEYFTIKPGQKVAVIQSAAGGGNLHVTELTQ